MNQLLQHVENELSLAKPLRGPLIRAHFLYHADYSNFGKWAALTRSALVAHPQIPTTSWSQAIFLYLCSSSTEGIPTVLLGKYHQDSYLVVVEELTAIDFQVRTLQV